MESTRWSRLAVLYASTIFLSAFLLFQVQPLISRFILPWFGGGPAVWTTCLLFFQTVLFAGYAYAHFSEHYFRPRARTVVHLALIGAALLTLPITPSDWWKPEDSSYPTSRILALLAVCVGLPYFVLSSTGPLVQAWFSQAFPGRSPYRLYSLSNFGSLLALLSYPFVVEPVLDGNAQGLWWTAGFVLFCILCGTACWQTAKLLRAAATSPGRPSEHSSYGGLSGRKRPGLGKARTATHLGPLVVVAGVPAFASVLLLATTNHVCQDMPAVPFLWVVPLSLYLLSFIIAFDHERWYRRLPYGLVAMIAIYLTAGISNPYIWGNGWISYVHSGIHWIQGTDPSPWKPRVSFNLSFEFTALFTLCMLCHGELVRLRPAPRYLTSFYLMISAGGALGGLSVSLIAPRVFSSYAEWKIGLVVGYMLAAVAVFVLAGSAGFAWPGWSGLRRPRLSLRGTLRVCGLLLATFALFETIHLLRKDRLSRGTMVEQVRNFYGVLSVIDSQDANLPMQLRQLNNGGIMHGMQYLDPTLRQIAATYYSDKSGVGLTLEYYQQESARTRRPIRVGVVGLGAGTLATYLYLPGHSIRFYEINPEVLRLAESRFTYLADARRRGATVEIALGDARLLLERELKEKSQGFDVLVLDAFSGDSIPIHLLTQEVFEVYLPHLAAEGALAVHVSNLHLGLASVVFGLAEHLGLDAVRITRSDTQHGGWLAEWVILTRNKNLLEKLRAVDDNVKPNTLSPPFPAWTDHRHNLLEILE